ncbi:MAG: phosphatase PAP2 family protein [Acidilobaceae archaeon]
MIVALCIAVALTVLLEVHVETLWKTVSFLGSIEFYVAVLPIVYHSLYRREAVGLAFSLLLTGTLVGVTKDLLKMPRPPEALSEGYGFPSGHASGSTAFWGFLALKSPSSPLALTFLSIAGLVSISRIVLGEHYPRDVVGGLVLGFSLAIVSHLLTRRLETQSLTALSLALGVVGLALFSVGYGALEPPAVMIGFSFAELFLERQRIRVERAGPLLGALGSVLAATVVVLAFATESSLVAIISYFLAGTLAVTIPKMIYRCWLEKGRGAD